MFFIYFKWYFFVPFLSGGLFHRDAHDLHRTDRSDWPGWADRWTEKTRERVQAERVALFVHRGRWLIWKTICVTPVIHPDTLQRCFNLLFKETFNDVTYLFFFCLFLKPVVFNLVHTDDAWRNTNWCHFSYEICWFRSQVESF